MCDSIVAAPTQTASGHTLYGKNSDRKPGECQPFVQFPEAHYARGSRLRCTHVEIPQVGETYRVMGLQGVEMTSVAELTGATMPLEEVAGLCAGHLAAVFGRCPSAVDPERLMG